MSEFKYPISFSKFIRASRSQAAQDLFAVAMLDGKLNGRFLDIGAAHPEYANNTWMLEKHFNFTGTCIDIALKEVDSHGDKIDWKLDRPNSQFIHGDAAAFDYSTLPPHIDYLSLDVDNPRTGLDVLKKATAHCSFGVITFEHDVWTKKQANIDTMLESRKLLKELNYELVVNNVVIEPGRGYGIKDEPIYFEDWYANPTHISRDIIDAYKWVDDGTSLKYPPKILFGL